MVEGENGSDIERHLFRKLAGAGMPLAPDIDLIPWKEAFGAAIELARTGQAKDAEARFHDALAYGQQIGGVALVVTLLQFADLFRMLGRYTEAEPLYRDGISLWDQHPGRDEDLATHLHNFGEVLHNSGRPSEAEPYARRALDIKERLWGPSSEEVAIALESLGASLNAQQKWEEAFPLYERMKKIRGEPFDGRMPV